MKSADGSVFSSNYEGQGLALIEAMMLGLPAIATDVVGSHSVLVGSYGQLVENSFAGLQEGTESNSRGIEPSGNLMLLAIRNWL